LDSAITDAGLTLDGLRRRLAARGVSVSRTILSYWRHGRSQPERATSLAAVAELEKVLNLPARSLTDRLGPHAPRGRWVAGPRGVLPRTRLWPGSAPLFADLHAPPDGQLEFWSIHDQVLLDAAGRERLVRVRLVARAAMDDVHRMMIYHQAPGLEPPRVAAVRFGRLGQVRVNQAQGLYIAELELERQLSRGDVTMIEYDLRMPLGQPADTYHRRFTRPVGQYVCQVRFSGRPPERIRQYGQRAYHGPRHYAGALSVGSTNAVTLALTDVEPGIAGADWQW
jgi:hypothetical protein